MTISIKADPTGGLEALGKIVPYLLKARPLSDRIVGGSVPKTSSALSVYTLGLNDAAKDGALAAATFVGWRYLIDDNGTLAVAEIRPQAAGEAPKFSRLTRGAAATGLKRAAEVASAAHGSSEHAYEARILEVPALHKICLWLHGDQDLFFRYLGPDGQVPDNIDEDSQYLPEIAAEARKKQSMKTAVP